MDGPLMVAWTDSGDLSVVDPAIWNSRSLPFQLGRVRGMATGPDNARVALGDENAVLIGTTNGIWATVPLRTDDLIRSAANGVTRGFTGDECATYRIDPCPTLEEIRSR